MTITIEEIYNKVSKHLLSMKKQSRNSITHKCVYRGPNGSKCAVGCLIKDIFYSKYLEDKGINHTSVYQAVIKSIGRPLSRDEKYILVKLQNLHDTTHYWNKDSGLNKYGISELMNIKGMVANVSESLCS